jgi:ParB family chromosome partitioning protein
MGHARALLALPDAASQRQAAREVISRALSVRDTESLVRKLAAPARASRAEGGRAAADVHTRAAEDRLRFTLGTKVRILRRAEGGTIEIAFGSESELNRIYEYLTDTRATHPNQN